MMSRLVTHATGAVENPPPSLVVAKREASDLIGRARGCKGRVRIAVGIALALWATAVAAAEPWGVYLHDNQHTGRAEILVDPLALDETPAWSAPSGYSAPLVVGDRVYAMRSQFGVGEAMTAVAAFDLVTGEILWETEQSLIFPSALAHHDGRLVYVGIDQTQFEPLLFVRDAETGEPIYSFLVPNPLISMPTIHVDAGSGEVVAYLAGPHFTNFGTFPNMTAVTIGEASAAIKWLDPVYRDFGDTSFPTIVGDSVVVVGPCHYYAYALESGDINEFHNGGCSGGGGHTVAYDAKRKPGQIYVVTAFDEGMSGDVLSAWAYRGQDDIALTWKSDEILNGIGVAVDGSTGAVYVGAYSRLLEIGASGGATTGFASGSFANGMVPILSGDFVWTFETSGFGDTVVYDIGTLDEVARFPGARGDLNSPFGAPGAFGFNAFLLDHGRIYDYPGFDVFLGPQCGDPVSPHGSTGASDALLVLYAAVGLSECAACICDVDSSGDTVATDALLVLARGVGLPIEIACPACS